MAGQDVPLGAGAALAHEALSVDLSDAASRARVRQLVEGIGADSSDVARSRVLARRILALAEADSGGARVACDLQRLATTLRKVDPACAGGRKGFLGKLLDAPGKRAQRLHASRKEIEGLVDALSASADTLRQSEVALRAYEADIEEERARTAASVALADDFEASLTTALAERHASGFAPDLVAFVERELLMPLEGQRQQLRSLLAVNQQAAFAVGMLRETNSLLVEQVRQVSWCTRHALDIASALQHASSESAVPGEPSSEEAPATPEALEASLAQLARVLESNVAGKSDATTQAALAELQSLSADV